MGSFFEILVTLVGLSVAGWALKLQRDEIIRNSHINALIYTSQLLQEKLDYRNRIIDSNKNNLDRLLKEKKQLEGNTNATTKIQKQIDKQKSWMDFHSQKVNNDLKPLKESIDIQIIQFASNHGGKDLFNIEQVNDALFSRDTKKYHKLKKNKQNQSPTSSKALPKKFQKDDDIPF